MAKQDTSSLASSTKDETKQGAFQQVGSGNAKVEQERSSSMATGNSKAKQHTSWLVSSSNSKAKQHDSRPGASGNTKAKLPARTMQHPRPSQPQARVGTSRSFLNQMAKRQQAHMLHAYAVNEITEVAHNPLADLKAPQTAQGFLFDPVRPEKLHDSGLINPSPSHPQDVRDILDGVLPSASADAKASIQLAQRRPTDRSRSHQLTGLSGAVAAQRDPSKTSLAQTEREPLFDMHNSEIDSQARQTNKIFSFSREDEHGGVHRLGKYKSPY